MNLFDMLPKEKQEKLMQSFGRDAQKAIDSLNDAQKNDDIQLMITAFHAMKSALANIGQTEKSEKAIALEKAGKEGNKEYIAENIKQFIETLRGLIPVENAAAPNNGEESVSEDTAFITERLTSVKAACDDYNYGLAESLLNELLNKRLRSKTRELLTETKDLLYSDSDFDGASEKISVFLNEYK
ncbi:MAG: Hpt domain-containing protein [Oscillospiraceae bacterium]|nr:Hpt domain-containing protein [Oscillospiraceae bacterium]